MRLDLGRVAFANLCRALPTLSHHLLLCRNTAGSGRVQWCQSAANNEFGAGWDGFSSEFVRDVEAHAVWDFEGPISIRFQGEYFLKIEC